MAAKTDKKACVAEGKFAFQVPMMSMLEADRQGLQAVSAQQQKTAENEGRLSYQALPPSAKLNVKVATIREAGIDIRCCLMSSRIKCRTQ